MTLHQTPRLNELYRYQGLICRVISVQYNADSPDMVQIQYAAGQRVSSCELPWMPLETFAAEAESYASELLGG